MPTEIQYKVTTFRDAGLEAQWSRLRSGAPVIAVRDPNASHEHQRKNWYVVTATMWVSMKKEGIKEAFNRHTLLADLFSIPA